MSADIKTLKHAFRLTDCGDSWGNAMSWWFTIADEIYFNRQLIRVPKEWGFKPSPLGPSNDEDDYITNIVQEANDESLLRFGHIINRYAGLLESKGMSY